MDTIANQVRELHANGTEDERRQLQVDLRELQASLDTEWDMVVRLGSGVRIPRYSLSSYQNFKLILPSPAAPNGPSQDWGRSQDL